MKIIIVSLVILFATSCQTGPDLEKEKAEIIGLLKMERRAHFEKNTALFMSAFADSMISVNRGIVSVADSDQTRRRIDRYFNRVDFVKWDDVVQPQISFADDGSMAYALVQKQVILSLKDSTRSRVLDTTDFAWVSIYRKTPDGWKIECNVSTNK